MKSIRCKLTPEGLEKLNAQKTKAQQRLHEIDLQMDDISLAEEVIENIEFQELREERVRMQDEIQHLSHIIDHATVLEDQVYDKALPGCQVQLGNHKICYILRLVSTYEADPREGKISCSSPIGQSLIGRRVGDEVLVPTPLGRINFNIVSIA